MKALIDTILNPLLFWLNNLRGYLTNADVLPSYQLNFSRVFAPITALSPAWAMFVSNVMVMIFIYSVLFIVHNGKDSFAKFVQSIKFW